MRIRLGTLKDLNKIVELRMNFLREVRDLKVGEHPKDAELEKNTVKYFKENFNKNCMFWIMEKESKIIATGGLILLERPPFFEDVRGLTGMVINIYILPDYRNKGAGKILMDTIIEYSKENNIKKLFLVSTDQGKSLYKKMGFKYSEKYMEIEL